VKERLDLNRTALDCTHVSVDEREQSSANVPSRLADSDLLGFDNASALAQGALYLFVSQADVEGGFANTWPC
jgi:hypothetical protein